MDKNTIGENAGILWRLLSDSKRWEYEELKAALKLSERDLNAAIGWLAREDKIFFDKDEEQGKEYLYTAIDFYF